MKKIVVVFLVGVVMFAGSATVSWHLRNQEAARHEERSELVHEKVSDKVILASAIPGRAPGDNPAPKTVLRPASSPSPENVVQLAANLRQQQESLKTKEEQLLVRKKHLEIIFQDMNSERKTLDGLRGQINEEMKALVEKLDSLERKASEVEKQKKKLTDQAGEIKKSMYEVEGVEQKGIKQIGSIYDTMDADTAADILQHMADTGKIDTAVKILSTMRERQAARVLAQIQDRSVVVQMLDRLKNLKRPGNPSPLE